MATTKTTTTVQAKSLMSDVTMVVRIKGMAGLKVRAAIAGMLIRLAAAVLGCSLEIETK